MFLYIKYLIMVLTTPLLLFIVCRALRLTQAIKLQRLLANDASGCCCSLGFIGCSILCRHIRDIGQIQSLLHSEHDRYEVILVLDINLQPKLFHDIVKQFKMVRVTSPTKTELNAGEIRQLYRSRQRCFRRLILIDKGQTTSYDDFNIAACMASFDYLIPLKADFVLRHKAIEDIAIMLSDNSPTSADTDLMYSTADNSHIFRRDAVIAAGGFSKKALRNISRQKSRAFHFPILKPCVTAFSKTSPASLIAISIILITLCWIDLAAALILATTLLAICCYAHYLTHLFDEECSLRTILCQISNIRHFFRPRNFFL